MIDNKKLVTHYLDQVFNHGDLAMIDTYVRSDLIQHNPQLPDGAAALQQTVAGMKTAYRASP